MIEKTTIECDECGATFKYKHHMLRHKRSKHEGVRYSCNYCDYKATQPGNLKTHKSSVHEGLGYACSYCQYIATKQDNLKRREESVHKGKKFQIRKKAVGAKTKLQYMTEDTQTHH